MNHITNAFTSVSQYFEGVGAEKPNPSKIEPSAVAHFDPQPIVRAAYKRQRMDSSDVSFALLNLWDSTFAIWCGHHWRKAKSMARSCELIDAMNKTTHGQIRLNTVSGFASAAAMAANLCKVKLANTIFGSDQQSPAQLAMRFLPTSAIERERYRGSFEKGVEMLPQAVSGMMGAALQTSGFQFQLAGAQSQLAKAELDSASEAATARKGDDRTLADAWKRMVVDGDITLAIARTFSTN